MLPILNQHLKNDKLETETEDIKDNAIEDEITDEEDDTTESNDSGFFSEIPTCAKVGLGVLGLALGCIAYKVYDCKSNNNEIGDSKLEI